MPTISYKKLSQHYKNCIPTSRTYNQSSNNVVHLTPNTSITFQFKPITYSYTADLYAILQALIYIKE